MTPHSLRLWSFRLVLLCGALLASTALASTQIRLAPDDASLGARFGASMGVDQDILVIGAPDDSTAAPYAGAAYLYARKGNRWHRQARLLGRLTSGYRAFGESVATGRGLVVVGAPFDSPHGGNSGAAYVYAAVNNRWLEQGRLTPADAAANQLFGDTVATDGTHVVIGAFLDSSRAPNAGAVHVFARSGSRWQQTAKLTADDASAYAFFGSSVAIEGNRLVVGSPTAERAYVFTLDATGWTQTAALSPIDAVPGDYTGFGAAVALSGDTIAVGAPSGSDVALRTGAVHVFAQLAGTWTPQARLTAADATEGDEFGTSVALDGTLLAAGAPYAGDANEGAVYVLERRASGWRLRNRHVARSRSFSAFFGASTALEEGRVFCGAPAYVEYAGRGSAGAAYVIPAR